jgi:hypothetical protein
VRMQIYQHLKTAIWRREWDSNPRYAFTHTRFPSVRLKPLGHPSCGRWFISSMIVAASILAPIARDLEQWARGGDCAATPRQRRSEQITRLPPRS